MSDDLKNDILKAVKDSKAIANGTSKPPADEPVFKDPQIVLHCLHKTVHPPQRLAENINSDSQKDSLDKSK